MDEFTAKWNVLNPEEEAKRQIKKAKFVFDLAASLVSSVIIATVIYVIAKEL